MSAQPLNSSNAYFVEVLGAFAGAVQRAPEACLELVDALTPTEPSQWFGLLSVFLRHVLEAKPELESDLKVQAPSRRGDAIGNLRAGLDEEGFAC